MKTLKIILFILTFLLLLPGMGGLAVMLLWNATLVQTCGFTAITFCQGIGIFFLGQILSAGILLAVFMFGGGLHAIIHHHSGHWGHHWHSMTDEQRREFIARRRAHFSFRHNNQAQDNVTE